MASRYFRVRLYVSKGTNIHNLINWIDHKTSTAYESRDYKTVRLCSQNKMQISFYIRYFVIRIVTEMYS